MRVAGGASFPHPEPKKRVSVSFAAFCKIPFCLALYLALRGMPENKVFTILKKTPFTGFVSHFCFLVLPLLFISIIIKINIKIKIKVNIMVKVNCKMTPVKAIGAKCLECSGGSLSEVKACPIRDCKLWPYRLGLDPNENQPTEVLNGK